MISCDNITILSLSWRDIRHPKMGGAEIYTHEVLKRFVANGGNVIHIAPYVDGLATEEIIDGVRYIRPVKLGRLIRYSRRYYKEHSKDIDVVIDQCNTYRSFTSLWVPIEKRVFLIFQLTREIWKINMSQPFAFVGEKLETPFLRMQRHDQTITISESTKQDLIDVGFEPDKIYIIKVGNDPKMLHQDIEWNRAKQNDFVFVGRCSKYKGIDICVEAVGIVKEKYSDVKLRIVGKKDTGVISEILEPICDKYNLSIGDDDSNDIVTCGFVTEEEKYNLMRSARALLFPSLREGWGMIITEAGTMGTPSITCDLPGTRDAVDFGKAGYMCANRSAKELASEMISSIEDMARYEKMSRAAYEFANTITWEKAGEEFCDLICSVAEEARKNR